MRTAVTPQGTVEVLCTISNDNERSSLRSDVAVNAAMQFTITQQKKLKELGALDVEQPICMVGAPVSENCDLGDCAIDYGGDAGPSSINTKIIHF